MLVGDNGIITQAQRAKAETEKMNLKESIELEILGSIADEGNYNSSIVKKRLENNLGATVKKISSSGSLVVEFDKNKFVIDKNGIVKDPISAQEGLEIGTTVIYTPNEAEYTWKAKYSGTEDRYRCCIKE